MVFKALRRPHDACVRPGTGNNRTRRRPRQAVRGNRASGGAMTHHTLNDAFAMSGAAIDLVADQERE